jgi:hypothetical protein
LIGLFGGMAIESWRDSVPTAVTATFTVQEPIRLPEPPQVFATPCSSKQQRFGQAKANPSVPQER